MPDPTFQVFIEYTEHAYWEDLTKLGSWGPLTSTTWAALAASSLTDVTSQVLQFNIERGRAEGFGRTVAGRAQVIFDNADRRFTPENSGSPYANHLVPNRQIIIQAASGYASAPGARLFTGLIDAWRVDPRYGQATVTVDCTDYTKSLIRRHVDMPITVESNVSSLIWDILSYAGLGTGHIIDVIPDQIPFAWFRDQEGLQALQALIEAGNYTMFTGSLANQMVVRGREYRVNSLAPVASYANAFQNLTYERSDDQIINIAQIEGSPRKLRSAVGTIAWLTTSPSPVFVGARSTLTFTLEYLDPDTRESAPAINIVQPVMSLDWALVGTATNVASAWATAFGEQAECNLYNGDTAQAQVDYFVLRGQPIQRQPTFRVTAETASSQEVYGKLFLSMASPYIGLQTYAQGYAEYINWRNHDIRPKVEMTFKNVWPDQITLGLLDVISVVESQSGVGSYWQITGIQHDVQVARGLEHETRYILERWRDAGWFVLDVSQLDQTPLGF